ncbi:DoxX family protein [Paraburkholderia sp. Ac-20336]|uniref:DoxX family protein n=1 Tax=Burkholderiaceae TaxID=119060 RepID=UPI00141FF18F|nr:MULTISPECIES: DoxX family protein [Burkholderiaceae]MBN3803064.1 DoxX family protein [Paraburkholderia sp. Ac-20336]MBN3848243.1 DoxX family protein [Paraburkholderia sp. Ac-20342]NIF53080.1 DoxX family protein [Burkholderia sp. Ax-1724]NIF80033.1 DoxX family protein [Paraburkholderia sp. Cy-641]
MPSFIALVLESPITLVFGRILLTTLFWSAGIFGLFNFSVIVSEMKAVNLPAPVGFAVATIAIQLMGSVLLIGNFNGLGWLGAGALGLFTLLTIPYGHAFWTFPEPRRTEELHIALEHISVAGGMLMAAILTLR